MSMTTTFATTGVKHAFAGLAALALLASIGLSRAEAGKAVRETGLVYADEDALFLESEGGEVYRLSGIEMASSIDKVVTVLGEKRLSEDGYLVFHVTKFVAEGWVEDSAEDSASAKTAQPGQ